MMKILLFVSLFFLGALRCCANGDTYPANGDEMIEGARLWVTVSAHTCSEKECSHFTRQEVMKATAVFNYVKGYVQGLRIAHAATKKRVFIFPPDGLDCATIMEPLAQFLETNPEAKAKPVSIGLYLYLKTRLPPGE